MGEGDGVILVFVFTNQIIFENEIVEAGVSKDMEGVVWSADDRLTVEIERGIENEGYTGFFKEGANQAVVESIN